MPLTAETTMLPHAQSPLPARRMSLAGPPPLRLVQSSSQSSSEEDALTSGAPLVASVPLGLAQAQPSPADPSAPGTVPPGTWTRAAVLAAQHRPQRFPRALTRTMTYQQQQRQDPPPACSPSSHTLTSHQSPATLLGLGGLVASDIGSSILVTSEGDNRYYDPPQRDDSVDLTRTSVAELSHPQRNSGVTVTRTTQSLESAVTSLRSRRSSIALPDFSRARTRETPDSAILMRTMTSSPEMLLPNQQHRTGSMLPDHHRPAGVGFRNPWPSAGREQYLSLLRPRGSSASAATGRGLLKVARDRKPPDELLATMLLLSARPDFAAAEQAVQRDKHALVCHWIGHATFVIHLSGLVILTDPVWAPRLGPLGARRLIPPPCDIADLPETIQIVLLTSTCYDHFDKHAIESLVCRVQRWLVPLGVKQHLVTHGVDAANVTELDWWDSAIVGEVSIVCTPSQHHSNRAGSLWCSWWVQTSHRRLFFCGGSGYRASSRGDDCRLSFRHRASLPGVACPAFREIHHRFGPCDVAFLPIGGASPRQSMSAINADAVDMLFMHLDLHARQSIAHHWGTFQAGEEGMLDPVRLLEAAVVESPISEFEVLYLKHGHLHSC